MRMLIVDDDQNGLLMLEAMLRGFGHEVMAAENGRIALELARVTPPELIISDILMPVMDGYALCREWKRDSKLRNIPFIFYTATYTDSRDEELALSLGAERFIVKPVAPDEFSRILQELIEGVEKGRVEPKKWPKKPALEEEKEIFKLYNQRLIKKLEKKMLDLEKEVVRRKEAEEKIKASLREKELLLREIHHRVKNNLQIISSILDMRAMRTDNQQVIDYFEDARSKIYTMAIIHEQLYQSEAFDRIDMGRHANELLDHISEVFENKTCFVTPVIDAENVFFSINQAIPCALVLNELISNAYKHAFVDHEKGTIRILLKRLPDDTVHIRVKDDGKGLPDEIDFERTTTLGLKLARTIVRDQLMGEIRVNRDQGTEIVIEFKLWKREDDDE